MARRVAFVLVSTEYDLEGEVYSEWVPIEGSYRDGEIVLPSSTELKHDEREWVAFGPVPDGSMALRLERALDVYPAGMILIFGVPGPVPAAGIGYFKVKGHGELIVRFRKKGAKTLIVWQTSEIPLPKAHILAFRPFLGAV